MENFIAWIEEAIDLGVHAEKAFLELCIEYLANGLAGVAPGLILGLICVNRAGLFPSHTIAIQSM